jgi:hypothetical protein
MIENNLPHRKIHLPRFIQMLVQGEKTGLEGCRQEALMRPPLQDQVLEKRHCCRIPETAWPVMDDTLTEGYTDHRLG